MITNRRMGLKIWRIQRIKIPGITESKRKPLDYKARQRVGIKTEAGNSSQANGFFRFCLPILMVFLPGAITLKFPGFRGYR